MDRLAVIAILLLSVAGGCNLLKSRYAMDDPVYAAKYRDGAPKSDLLGKAKQMLDARHTEGLVGYYASGGAQVLPESGNPLAGLEIGGEAYAKNWLTSRIALTGFTGKDDGLLALDLGSRVQLPTRLAPFAGVGTFHGISRRVRLADNDWADNDDDQFIDEPGEKEEEIGGWLSAVYPEIGAHFWIAGHWRLTAFGRYLITTDGRASDEWLIGGQLAVFAR